MRIWSPRANTGNANSPLPCLRGLFAGGPVTPTAFVGGGPSTSKPPLVSDIRHSSADGEAHEQRVLAEIKTLRSLSLSPKCPSCLISSSVRAKAMAVSTGISMVTSLSFSKLALSFRKTCRFVHWSDRKTALGNNLIQTYVSGQQSHTSRSTTFGLVGPQRLSPPPHCPPCCTSSMTEQGWVVTIRSFTIPNARLGLSFAWRIRQWDISRTLRKTISAIKTCVEAQRGEKCMKIKTQHDKQMPLDRLHRSHSESGY